MPQDAALVSSLDDHVCSYLVYLLASGEPLNGVREGYYACTACCTQALTYQHGAYASPVAEVRTCELHYEGTCNHA